VLLERNWEEVKNWRLNTFAPIIKDVYAQELMVLPGMDSALVLNAIRGTTLVASMTSLSMMAAVTSTVRMLGMPETLSWYSRRFGKLLQDSDLGKTVSPLSNHSLAPYLTSVGLAITLTLTSHQYPGARQSRSCRP